MAPTTSKDIPRKKRSKRGGSAGGDGGSSGHGRDTSNPPFLAFVGNLPKEIVQGDVDKLFNELKIRTIHQLKTVSPELQLELIKFFFIHGFCKKRAEPVENQEENEEEEEPATTTTTDDEDQRKLYQKQCVSYFLSAIRNSFNMEVISSLHEYVVSIVKGNVDDEEESAYELLTPLTDKGTRLFSKAGKILKKISQPMLANITRVAMLQILTNRDMELVCFESWLDVVKKAMKKDPNLETIFYILDTVVQEDSSFFNYEAIFRLIVMQMQNQVPEEVIQAIADAIDPAADTEEEEDDEIDFDDNEEEGDDDDDDDDDDEIEDEDIEAETPENDDSQLFSSASAIQAAHNGDSDSDATIDMDDATEEDLKKMDMALANVFATKKRMKEQSKLENRTYMRVLHLVDILLARYKDPPISMALMLLMPLVSKLKNSLQVKGNQDIINRTLSTLKRLNKFTKFSGKEEVDAEILSTMAQEIRQLMKKKFVSKDVKNVLFRSVSNILSSQDEKGVVSESRKAKKKKAKAKAKAAKKEEKTVTLNGGTATENGDSKKNKKKKNRKITAKTNTAEPVMTNGDSGSHSKTTTTTVAAKKDKKKKKKDKKNKKSKVENDVGSPQQQQSQQKMVVADSVVSTTAKKPTKRKAQGMSEKKKAKLLRMQVHSEGLMIDSLDD